MARTKRRVRNRGRKSQKIKPVRTRRRRRGSAKRRRTKSRKVLKGKGCLGGIFGCGLPGSSDRVLQCRMAVAGEGRAEEACTFRGTNTEIDAHVCNVHCDTEYVQNPDQCRRVHNCNSRAGRRMSP